MLESNVQRIIAQLPPDARVLDVGGWYVPFNFATDVVDVMPHGTRGEGQGPLPQRFGADSWVQLDVCRDPLQYADKTFDFVVCSHTLEDIRDPIFLCSELNRVGKAGYLETPSALAELTFGIESKQYAGWYHHRWLVEMTESHVIFRHKPHLINGHWRYHFPKRVSRTLTSEEKVTWMVWQESFTYEELIELDMGRVQDFVEGCVRQARRRPEWVYRLLPLEERVRSARNEAGATVRRLVANHTSRRDKHDG